MKDCIQITGINKPFRLPHNFDKKCEILLNNDFSGNSPEEIIRILQNETSALCSINFHLESLDTFEIVRVSDWQFDEKDCDCLVRDSSTYYYPKNKNMISMGRCNLPKQQVLYASELFTSALNEKELGKGDKFFISSWAARNSNNLQFTYFPFLEDNHPSIRPIETFERVKKQIIEKTDHKTFNYLKKVMDFYCTIFCRSEEDIPDKIKYAISSALSNYYFNNGTDIIIYPSIKNGLFGLNFAIKKEIADSVLSLKQVLCCVMTGSPSKQRAPFEIIAVGNNISGTINFKKYTSDIHQKSCENLLKAKYSKIEPTPN